jgi:hypothetical protein
MYISEKKYGLRSVTLQIKWLGRLDKKHKLSR